MMDEGLAHQLRHGTFRESWDVKIGDGFRCPKTMQVIELTLIDHRRLV